MNRLFLACLPALAVAGCTAQELYESGLTVPGPLGTTPLDDALQAIPRVVGNPLDLGAWQMIATAAVLGIGAIFGYKRVIPMLRTNAETRAVNRLQGEGAATNGQIAVVTGKAVSAKTTGVKTSSRKGK